MAEDERFLEIQKMAYYKWAEAGYPPSDGVTFWLKAEEEYDQGCYDLALGGIQPIVETVGEQPQPASGYLKSILNRLRS
jgi:hypothetical protein